jgi:V-type H+-transporting ATPase subunit E
VCFCWEQPRSPRLSPAQEFNLEKLQLLEQEKAKIRKEYERREGQVEIKKKM